MTAYGIHMDGYAYPYFMNVFVAGIAGAACDEITLRKAAETDSCEQSCDPHIGKMVCVCVCVLVTVFGSYPTPKPERARTALHQNRSVGAASPQYRP